MTITSQKPQILIRKASGEEELFSTEKLIHSLTKAGAKDETINQIVTDIEKWVFPGVTTKQIYTKAFAGLRLEKTSAPFHYKLKQAMLEIGPTGYPFEILIGEIFKLQGYKTEVGVVVAGQCVTHEMDVIATKDKSQQLVECKYHKDRNHVSVQVPLYVRSRVNDIIAKREQQAEFYGYDFTGWVVTNTRFTPDATQYGTCSGLKLIAWDFPHGHGLKDLIDQLKVYPITVLQKLTIKEKQYLMDKGIVTCRQLHSQFEILDELDLSKNKKKAVHKEIERVCNHSK